MKRKILSICNRDCDAEIIEENEDEMQTVIKCPYCWSLTTVGNTRMISGFVGCDNCYFVKGGLLETVLYLREHDYHEYCNGDFYRRGYRGNLWTNMKKLLMR